MARSTLSVIIEDLRGMTDAGPADYNVGTAVYWDDNQLQTVLDRHRRDFRHIKLDMSEDWVGGGSVQYRDYYSPVQNIEQTDGGTAVFWIEDSTGANVGTANWTADYRTGLLTFTANQAGTVYYATGRSYNLHAAAADVWRMKAANVAKYYDINTDNHGLSRSQMHRQFIEMANYYLNQAPAKTVSVQRGDLCDG